MEYTHLQNSLMRRELQIDWVARTFIDIMIPSELSSPPVNIVQPRVRYSRVRYCKEQRASKLQKRLFASIAGNILKLYIIIISSGFYRKKTCIIRTYGSGGVDEAHIARRAPERKYTTILQATADLRLACCIPIDL